MTPFRSTTFSTVRAVIDASASLAMLGAAGAVVWSTVWGSAPDGTVARRTAPTSITRLGLEGTPVLGSPHAKFAIVEFSDFQCPYCVKFANEILPELKKAYIDTGKVQLSFRHLPLTSIHPRSGNAAHASVCAAEQNKFWPFHDQLFSKPSRLEDEDLRTFARASGMMMPGCESCLKQPHAAVDSDVKAAQSFGLATTPAFLIGRSDARQRVEVRATLLGAVPVGEFAKALRSLGL